MSAASRRPRSGASRLPPSPAHAPSRAGLAPPPAAAGCHLLAHRAPRAAGPARLGSAVALAALALLAPDLRADEPPALYTLTANGRMALWGTVLDALPTFGVPGGFADLLADGGDRLALRRDGRLFRNGETLQDLPATLPGEAWTHLTRRGGDLLALSSHGLLARLSDTGQLFVGFVPAGPFLFTDLLADGGAPFLVLRSDGLLFGPELLPVGLVVAGPGIDGAFDGTTPATSWVQLAWDADAGRVLALRSDGRVVSFSPAALLDPDAGPGAPAPFVSPVYGQPGGLQAPPLVGLPVAALPFGEQLRDRNDTYIRLAAAGPGGFTVLRRDGAVFDGEHRVQPAVPPVGLPFFGLPPALDPLGIQSSFGNPFVDLLLDGGVFWRLRSLGHLYQSPLATPIADLDGSGHRGLAAAEDAPDLSNVDNRRPVITTYTVKVIAGDAIDVPLIATDVDQPQETPVFDVDLTDIPGATYDAEAGIVNLPPTLAVGKYRYRVTADDGSGDKPRSATFPVRVLANRDAKGRNHRPVASPVSNAAALVGIELVLPILAADADGDALTIEPTGGDAFERGATFDADLGALRWSPGCEDVGNRKAVFTISDGQRQRKLTVTIRVLFPLGLVATPN